MAAEALRVAREMACARDPREIAAAAGAAVEDAAGVVTLTVAFLDGSIGLTWPGPRARRESRPLFRITCSLWCCTTSLEAMARRRPVG